MCGQPHVLTLRYKIWRIYSYFLGLFLTEKMVHTYIPKYVHTYVVLSAILNCNGGTERMCIPHHFHVRL